MIVGMVAWLLPHTVAAEPPPRDPDIERFTLDNGLEVALAPDPRLPLVAIDLMVQVGFRDEDPGRAEMAHLVEHLLASEGENLDYMTDVASMGGVANATTDDDVTRYFVQAPRAALNRLLWLDAHRLRDGASRIDQADLERERAVVLRELELKLTDHRDQSLSQDLQRLLWDSDDPRSRTDEQRFEGVRATTLEDVRGFIGRTYAPSRTTLAVAGDFDPVETRAWIEQTFGVLADRELAPRAALSAPDDAVPSKDAEDEGGGFAWVQADIVNPRVVLAWRSAPSGAPDTPELFTLASLLGGASPAYLVGWLNRYGPRVVSVHASQRPADGGGLFVVQANLLPDVPPHEVIKDIRQGMLSVQVRGVFDDDVAEVRDERRRQTWAALDSPASRARTINFGTLAGLRGSSAVALWKRSRGLESLRIEATLYRWITRQHPAVLVVSAKKHRAPGVRVEP
jgi:zinc protease